MNKVASVKSPPPALESDVAVPCSHWMETLADAETLSQAAAEAAFLAVGRNRDEDQDIVEVSIVLADDDFVRNLNRDYRDQDKPTNVLSFPASSPGDAPPGAPVLLGDVIVAFETVSREAEEQGKALGDHLCHLVVHGMLHLLGFDHQTAPEAEKMESLETDILATLNITNPYQDKDQG
ncbi:MAG: rRNA maturation RNase YbeY [Rhodospirillales bacterium]|nr:rRNA maturation RNase YbeY [Rhodospirillales bacterium]